MPVNQEALRLIREGFAVSGMTQEELARASGIPRSTLANILSPSAAPRLIHVGQLVKIAVAIGVDARGWIARLEALERRLSGDRRKAPQVQLRAARSRSSRAKLGQD